jgi:hypothetical protein
LQRLRQNHFPHCSWLLERWRIARAVRAFMGPDQAECRRLLQPIWTADNLAAVEALRAGPCAIKAGGGICALLGCCLNNGQGMNGWR